MCRNIKLLLLINLILCGHAMAIESDTFKMKGNRKHIGSDKSPSLILQNTALVRLGGQVFFLTDVDHLQKSYKGISCLGNNSYIEHFLNNANESLIPRPWRTNNISEENPELPQQLQMFILIEKLKLSSVSSANTNFTTLDLVKLSKNCSRLKWNDLNSDVRSLFLSEIYLRQRFSGSKELDSALTEFVNSLNLQHKHELLRLHPSKLSLKVLQNRGKAIQEKKTE